MTTLPKKTLPEKTLPENLSDNILMPERKFCGMLSEMISVPVKIRFTCNRSRLISVRTDRDGAKVVRLQHTFRASDKNTLEALAHFIESKNSNCQKVINDFISKKQEIVKFFSRPPVNRNFLPSKGAHRNLANVLQKVGHNYGLDISGIQITWSALKKTRGRRFSICFGSYCASKGIIKIHPDLDSLKIPDYFVEYVVYHEILHAKYPPVASGNGVRRQVHTPQFRFHEKRFRQYKEARKFEKIFIKARLG